MEIPARSASGQWQSYRRWWTTASLKSYPGVWEMQFWVNDEPIGRYFFEIGEATAAK